MERNIVQQRRKCIAKKGKITKENTKLHRRRGKDSGETVRDLMGEQVTARKKLGRMIKEKKEKEGKLLVRKLENDI